jgi:hypothetical protein
MTGGFGSLAQVLPIIERLPKSKFKTVFSIAHGAAHAIQKLQYDFIPYPDAGTPGLVTPKGRTWCDLDHYWGRFGFADENYFTKLVESRLRIVEELQPGLLLTQFCPPTEIIARITGIPLICVTQSCWHPKGKSLTWWQSRQMDYPRVTPVVNKILRQHGAEPIERMEDLNRGNLTIIPGFPEFDPVQDEVLYTGPLQWDSSAIMNGVSFEPSSFDAKNTVLVYTGHLYDTGGESGILILDTIMQALANTQYNVLLTTGLGQQLDRSKYSAPNIHLFDWLPVNKAIPHCGLFVHHGGHGSCMAAISHGVPSLVIPTFQEREFNARQLNLLGLGDFILPHELTANVLREKIDESINNSLRRSNAINWLHKLSQRNYQGAKLAADAINRLANNQYL